MRHIGTFNTAEEAAEAYAKEYIHLHGTAPESGYRGVYRTHSGTNVAQISQGGRIKCLGTFQSVEEAAQVFAKENQRVHGALWRDQHGTEGAAPDAVCEAAGKDDAQVPNGNRARNTFETHPGAKQFVRRLVDTNAGIVCDQVHAFDMRSMYHQVHGANMACDPCIRAVPLRAFLSHGANMACDPCMHSPLLETNPDPA